MSPSCLCCLLLLTLVVLGEEEDGQSRDGSHSVGESLAPRTQPEGHGAEGNEMEQPEASQGTGGDTGGAGNPTPPKTPEGGLAPRIQPEGQEAKGKRTKQPGASQGTGGGTGGAGNPTPPITPEEDLASAPRTQPESHGAEGPDSDHHGGNSPSTRGDKNRSQTANKKKAGQPGTSHGTRSGHPAPHNNHAPPAPPAPHGSPGSPGYPAPPAPSAPESPGEGLEPGTKPGSPGAEENETEQTGNPQGSGGDTGGAGNPTPTVAPAQCRLSEIKGINGTAGEKEHYDPGESVSVWCSPGYYPNNMTMRCIGNGTSATWDDPIRCTEQCRKSALSLGTNVQLVPPQDYYLPNTGVSVRCPGGYKPSRDRITCKAEQDKSVWDVTEYIHCVAQCAKPTAPGIESVSNQKDYYNRGEEVRVTCAPGYQSVSQKIACVASGTHSNWDVPVPCIEQCQKSALSLGTNVQLVPPQDYYLPNTGVSVRCPGGYKPSRGNITCKAEQDKSVWDVTESIHCVGKLKFTQFPINNNNNNILKWRLSEIHGVVIGYQLNMVAWKEHTVIEEESQRLPPNVMEHRIPMEPGSSYMVTVRALTAAGPGEASLWLSGTPKATGASDSYVRVSLVLKPLFLTVLILILLCVTVREKWEQRGAGDENQWIETGRGGSEEMAPL